MTCFGWPEWQDAGCSQEGPCLSLQLQGELPKGPRIQPSEPGTMLTSARTILRGGRNCLYHQTVSLEAEDIDKSGFALFCICS